MFHFDLRGKISLRCRGLCELVFRYDVGLIVIGPSIHGMIGTANKCRHGSDRVVEMGHIIIA